MSYVPQRIISKISLLFGLTSHIIATYKNENNDNQHITSTNEPWHTKSYYDFIWKCAHSIEWNISREVDSFIRFLFYPHTHAHITDTVLKVSSDFIRTWKHRFGTFYSPKLALLWYPSISTKIEWIALRINVVVLIWNFIAAKVKKHGTECYLRP